jgi:adenylate cyclase, class 2
VKQAHTRVNLEAKALDPDPQATTRMCVDLGASEAGLLRQRDTYFDVRVGRLKLREDLDARTAELIAYERPAADGIRVSRYRRLAVSQPAETCELLAAALGVSGVVEKERRLFLFENVRIHLDHVASLGCFVELESVLASPDGVESEAEREALARVVAALQMNDREAVALGYADLIDERRFSLGT